MKKKLKKSLACLLAALLIFSAVPMSALADEADTPVSVTVETNAEKAAQDTEPDAEPKPETTAEPTATPEASAKPSADANTIPYPIANTYFGSNTDVDTYFCTGRIVKNRKYFRFFD